VLCCVVLCCVVLADQEGSEFSGHMSNSLAHLGVMVRIALNLKAKVFDYARDFYDQSDNVSFFCSLFTLFFVLLEHEIHRFMVTKSLKKCLPFTVWFMIVERLIQKAIWCLKNTLPHRML
jgi:hypothetical protein